MVEEPTISSAFQLSLQPNYSGEDSQGTFWGVGRSWMSFKMWQDAKACVCVSLFCFYLPVLVFHWAIPKHSSFFLCRSCCVGSLPPSFPGLICLFLLLPCNSLSRFCLGFPQERAIRWPQSRKQNLPDAQPGKIAQTSLSLSPVVQHLMFALCIYEKPVV